MNAFIFSFNSFKKTVSFLLMFVFLLESCTYKNHSRGMTPETRRSGYGVRSGDTMSSVEIASKFTKPSDDPLGNKNATKRSWISPLITAAVGLAAGFAVGFGPGYGVANNQLNTCNAQVNLLSQELYGTLTTVPSGAKRLLQSTNQTYTPGCLGLLNGYVDLVNKTEVYGCSSALFGNATIVPNASVINGLNSSVISSNGIANEIVQALANITSFSSSLADCTGNINVLNSTIDTYSSQLAGNTTALSSCLYQVFSKGNNSAIPSTSCTTFGPNCGTCAGSSCLSCTNGYFLNLGGASCVTCSSAIPNCSSCIISMGITKCNTCVSGYNLSNGSCFAKTCTQPNCAICTTSACLTCKSGYSNVDGSCVVYTPSAPSVTDGLRVGYIDSAYEMTTSNEYITIAQAAQAGYNVVIIAFANFGSSGQLLINSDQFLAYSSYQSFSQCPCAIAAMTNDIAMAKQRYGLKYVLASIGGSGTTLPIITNVPATAQNIVDLLEKYTLDGVDFDIECHTNGDTLAQVISAIKAINSSIIISAAPQANSVASGSTTNVALVTTGTYRDYDPAISQNLFDYMWLQGYDTGPKTNKISWNGDLTDETQATYIPAATAYFKGDLSAQPPLVVPSSTVFIVGQPSQPISAGLASVWNNPIYSSETAVFNALKTNYTGTPGAMTWSINEDVDNGCSFAKAIFPQFGATNIVCPTNSTLFWNPGNINLNSCNVCSNSGAITQGTVIQSCSSLFGANCIVCSSTKCTACSNGYTLTNGACVSSPFTGHGPSAPTTGCPTGTFPWWSYTSSVAAANGWCYPCSSFGICNGVCSLNNSNITVCGTETSGCSVSNCTTCSATSSSICTTCNSGYTLSTSGNSCLSVPFTQRINIPTANTKNLMVGYLPGWIGANSGFTTFSQGAKLGYNIIPAAFAAILNDNTIQFVGDQFAAYTGEGTFTACSSAITAMKDDIANAKANFGLTYALISIGGSSASLNVATSSDTVSTLNWSGIVPATLASNMVTFMELYGFDGFDFDIEVCPSNNGAARTDPILYQIISNLVSLRPNIVISIAPMVNSIGGGSNYNVALVANNFCTTYEPSLSSGLINYVFAQLYNSDRAAVTIKYNGALVDETMPSFVNAAYNLFTGVSMPGQTATLTPVPAGTIFVGGLQAPGVPGLSVWTGSTASTMPQVQAAYTDLPGMMVWSIYGDIASNCSLSEGMASTIGITYSGPCPTSSLLTASSASYSICNR